MNAFQRIYKDRVVLITGGTKGLGLCTALVFAAHGAQTVLTYRWGSADTDEVQKQFTSLGAPEPLIIEADIAKSDDTDMLFRVVKKQFGRVDTFISNASNASSVRDLDDLTERAFLKSMRAGAWPTVDYTLACKRHLGRYPRYVVVISSDGADRFTPAYDYVAATKSAVETLARYLAYRLRDEDFRINVIRSRGIRTDSFTDMFGSEFYEFLHSLVSEDWMISADEVANAAFGLCTGMFDAMTGQVVMVDRGNAFADGISLVYNNRKSLGQ